MICIFSSSLDYSTTEVIKWLHHLGINDVLRVNFDDDNSIRINVAQGDFCFQLNNRLIYLDDIEAVWYRKGKNWLCNQFYDITIDNHSKFTTHLNKKLQAEELKLSEYLHFMIENTIPALGSSMKGDLNKLLVLQAAKEIGFLIPNSYICNYKEGIKQIFDQIPDLITKSISDGLYLFEKTENETGYFSYTEKLDKKVLEHLPEQISPSFLQENINKKFDIRVFFLIDKCYSMAILSQSDEQTRIDFRKYNEKKPNRNIPFRLPDEIDQKIKELFKKLKLNTGSVDLILDQQDNYYFLEINPVGQFGMVSEPCNYFLEKQVALKLIEYARKSKRN